MKEILVLYQLLIMETLLVLQQRVEKNLQRVIQHAEDNNLTNTQEFIDFLDKINELSVKY